MLAGTKIYLLTVASNYVPGDASFHESNDQLTVTRLFIKNKNHVITYLGDLNTTLVLSIGDPLYTASISSLFNDLKSF
jgi:hypothetical protein